MLLEKQARIYINFDDVLATLCVPSIFEGRHIISRRRDDTSISMASTNQAMYLPDRVDYKGNT